MTGRQDLFEESMRLGHSAAWDQDWERAIEFYRKALAEFPDNPEALSSLGLALLEIGRPREALAAYNQAARVAPEDPVPAERCAEIFEQLEQKEEAVQQRKLAADRYLKRRDPEKAIENWKQAGRLSPGDLKVRSHLALAYERLGRRREAVHEYLAVASIMQKAGRVDQALEAVKRALGLLPGDPDASKAMRLLRQGSPLPPPLPPLGSTRPLRPVTPGGDTAPLAAETGPLTREPEVVEEAPEEEGAFADPETEALNRALQILADLVFEEPAGVQAEPNGDEEGPSVSAIARGLSRGDRQAGARPSMYRYLGEAVDLYTRGQTRQAAKELERAIQAGLHHPAAHYVLGEAYKQLDDYEAARTQFAEAVSHPDLALGANLALGRLCKLQEDLAEAARYCLQALRLADTMSADESQSAQLNDLYDSLQASQDQGDPENLAKIVESTLNFLSGPEWRRRVRQARQQLGGQEDGGEAVVSIAEVLALGGSDRVLQALGRIDDYVRQGLLTTAMEEAMLALQHSPTYLAVHRRMAEILVRAGRVQEGQQKLAVIAETHLIRGEAKRAMQTYQRVLQLAPLNLEARRRLIDLLVSQDQVNDAVEQYFELAEVYRQMAEIDRAREALQQGLDLARQRQADRALTLRILHQMADIDLARLDWRSALRAYEAICELDPDDEQARAQVIDLLLRLGREEEAAKHLDAYLEHLVRSGEAGRGLALLEELVREHPGKPVLHARLAEAYRAAGRTADAIAQYDALGEIQLDAGQTEAAIRTIEKIIALNPPDVEGYKELLRNLKAGLEG